MGTTDLSLTKVAKAMAHPTRERALRILNQRVASPSDIAEELQLSIATVSYHVKTLLQLGCIEEVETRVVRGAIEHRYRAIVRPMLEQDGWDALPPSARRSIEQALVAALLDDLRRSCDRGLFDALPNGYLSRTPLRLDVQAWNEIWEDLSVLLERALAKQSEAAARLADGQTGGPEVSSILGMLHFPVDYEPAQEAD